MTTRRLFLAGLIAAAITSPAAAQETPSAGQILRQLEAAPKQEVAPEDRVTIRELKRRPSMRRIAPSIDIRGINFAFGSAEIPRSERWKVENIGDALNQLLDRNPDTIVLIEGHTDAVGSRASNQRLSEARAASLKRDLRRYFGVPSYNLETVGYGEDFLIVPTPDEEWRNRRVTLREVSDLIRR
jgi:outer membrane protein OmpA-like peptidoglycan-associated protein